MTQTTNVRTIYGMDRNSYNPPDRLLARADVEDRVGLGRSAIYRLMREGQFPEPFRIGPGTVRWSAREIEEWVASRPRSHGHRAA